MGVFSSNFEIHAFHVNDLMICVILFFFQISTRSYPCSLAPDAFMKLLPEILFLFFKLNSLVKLELLSREDLKKKKRVNWAKLLQGVLGPVGLNGLTRIDASYAGWVRLSRIRCEFAVSKNESAIC